MCARLINGLEHPSSNLSLPVKSMYLIQLINFKNLFRVGLYFFIYVSCDVVLCETSNRVIESRVFDVTYSEGVRGDILLHVDLIKRRLISTVNPRVIMVEI